MRLALLDLGTAALRFEVFEVEPVAYLANPNSKTTEKVYQERLMPRLGRGLYQTGLLSEEGMEQTREFFSRIPDLCLELRVENIRIGATSALREAKNGAEFVRELGELAQSPIELLTGAREAELIARGICSHESKLEDELVFVDIGGGSTEISYFSAGTVKNSQSIQLGAIRGNQDFLRCTPDEQMPPAPSAVAALRTHAQSMLQEFVEKHRVEKLLGTSGTIRTLCKLNTSNRRHPQQLYAAEVSALVEQLCTCNFAQRLSIDGLEKNRADIIVAGAVIFEEVMNYFHAQSVRVSPFSLRHGLLDEAIRGPVQSSG